MPDETGSGQPPFKRKWKRWAFALCMVIVLLPYVYSRSVANQRISSIIDLGADTNSKNFANEFTLLIFNIAHGRGTASSNFDEGGKEKKVRIRKIAKFLENENADIVILNEVDFCCTWSGHQNQAETIAEIAGYRYFGEQRNLDFGFVYGSWQFGNAILSKFPIASSTPIDYPAESDLETLLAGKKTGAEFSFGRDGKTFFNVVPIHLEHRNEEVRNNSAVTILKHLDSSNIPTILAGDFNSTPTFNVGPNPTSSGENAMDTLIESGLFHSLSDLRYDIDPTYPSTDPSKTIDWIMIPQSFTILEYRVLQCDLSDHLPVIAKIRIQP